MRRHVVSSSLIFTMVFYILTINLLSIPVARAQYQVPKVLDNTGSTRFHWLLVGQNDENLDFPDHDAERMHWWLSFWCIYGGFCPMDGSSKTLLRNQDANKTAIANWFNATKEIAQPGDTVVFYFSGHGWDNMIYPNPLCDVVITNVELTNMLSGFLRGVTFVVILDSCYSHTFVDGEGDLPTITDENGQTISLLNLAVIMATSETFPEANDRYSFTIECLVEGLLAYDLPAGIAYADRNRDRIVTAWEIFTYANRYWQGMFSGDTDNDGDVDEDDTEYALVNGRPTYLHLDNDNDGLIDEDPAPRNATFYGISHPITPVIPVGGVTVDAGAPIEELVSWVYIGLTSTIFVVMVVSAVYLGHVKYRKEK